MTAWAILPASGTGQRFAAHPAFRDKLTAPLGGIPVLVRSLRQLFASGRIAGAVLVVHADKRAEYEALLAFCPLEKPVLFTEGGETRRESVYNGLLALPEDAGIAVIHDAARPLIQPEVVSLAVEAVASGADGVVVGLPVFDTVKQVVSPDNPSITGTIDRSCLWRAQTPQVFRRDIILKAHQSVPEDIIVTDDAQLVELCGDPSLKVLMVPGSESNLKITTPGDLTLAEALLKNLDEPQL